MKPHARVPHVPRAGDALHLDDGRRVIVVNSNGRSKWMHVRTEAGAVIEATFEVVA